MRASPRARGRSGPSRTTISGGTRLRTASSRLNNTLGFVTASASGNRRVAAAFKLARPARVALRIETPGGAHRRRPSPRGAFPQATGRSRGGVDPAATSSAPPPRTRSERWSSPLLSGSAASLRRSAGRQLYQLAHSLIGNHGALRRVSPDGDRRRAPCGERARDGLRRRTGSGAFAGQHVDALRARISSHAWAYVAMALAGTLGYLVGSIVGWAIGLYGGRPLAGAARALVPSRRGQARAG